MSAEESSEYLPPSPSTKTDNFLFNRGRNIHLKDEPKQWAHEDVFSDSDDEDVVNSTFESSKNIICESSTENVSHENLEGQSKVSSKLEDFRRLYSTPKPLGDSSNNSVGESSPENIFHETLESQGEVSSKLRDYRRLYSTPKPLGDSFTAYRTPVTNQMKHKGLKLNRRRLESVSSEDDSIEPENSSSNSDKNLDISDVDSIRYADKSRDDILVVSPITKHSLADISSSSQRSTSSSLNLSDLSQSGIEQQLALKKKLLKNTKINLLPDKGARIKEQISILEDALSNINLDDGHQNSTSSSSHYFADGSLSSHDLHPKADSVASFNESSKSNISNVSSYKSFHSKSSNDSCIEIIDSPQTWPSSEDHLRKSYSPEIQELSPPQKPAASRIEDLKMDIANLRMALKSANLKALPDKGSSMQRKIYQKEKELMMLELKAEVEASLTAKAESSHDANPFQPNVVKDSEAPKYHQTKLGDYGLQLSSLATAIGSGKGGASNLENLYDANTDIVSRDYGGKLSSAREYSMIRVTSDAVEHLHETLKSMPDVDRDEMEDPEGLRINLMTHQKRGLCWLLWREAQNPPGGILADDMGLGKTLSMLSLILSHNQLVEQKIIEDDVAKLTKNERWLSKDSESILPSYSTLVVCPASLLGQWEGEAKRLIKRRHISTFVYHGKSRNITARRLSEYDMVVTTYQIIMREAFPNKKNKINTDDVPEISSSEQGLLFKIGWTRIILDEAHQIRNHKSQTSQAVCMLRGGRRWAVTGTPIQNKDMDLYSLVRFLRISPFEKYTVWKHQVQNSSVHGMMRLNLLVRAHLLRRTKDQVDNVTGESLVNLPEKEIIQHNLCLSQEERQVYDRVFSFSKNTLIEYMKSHEQKEEEKAFKGGKPSDHASNTNFNSDKYTPTLQGDFGTNVKTHHILILLLRLRQICCHPSLIRGIIEDEAKSADGITEKFQKDAAAEKDLIEQMAEMTLREEGPEEEEVDNRVRDEVLNAENPIFRKKARSSKIGRVIEELQEILNSGNGDKAIIVSQWTSMLEVVHRHLRKSFKCTAITGQVPVKERTAIVDEFNSDADGSQVMLLSLAAGGVGLNLVGANHLFLLDMHWNPQLERQACDRIYRVGQKKPVKIHRFVVENTIEEKILELQKKKLQLAEDVLTGAKKTLPNKLTIDDLMALFEVDRQ